MNILLAPFLQKNVFSNEEILSGEEYFKTLDDKQIRKLLSIDLISKTILLTNESKVALILLTQSSEQKVIIMLLNGLKAKAKKTTEYKWLSDWWIKMAKENWIVEQLDVISGSYVDEKDNVFFWKEGRQSKLH